jgi:hypothetical protein
MRKDSDPDLWQWFLDYRRRYFYRKGGTELPDPEHVTVFWHPCPAADGKIGDYGECYEIEPGEFVLKVSAKYAIDSRQARIALLHEMVHLKLWPYKNHGPTFHKEMLRLAKLGAFHALW